MVFDMSPSLKSLFRLFLAAFLLRWSVALLAPDNGDLANFITTGQTTLQGGNIYLHFDSYNYPPLYAWLLAGILALGQTLSLPATLVARFWPILADSSAAVAVYAIAQQWHPSAARWLGWVYALNPVTIAISAYHGHFDALAYFPTLVAIWWHNQGGSTLWCGLALGLGGAFKIVPAFTGLAWFRDLWQRPWQLLGFCALIGLVVGLALLSGYLSAPAEFINDVLAHRRIAEGGWSYNFPILIVEWFAKRQQHRLILDATQFIRGLSQPILLSSLLLTAYLTRHRSFLERAILLQLAVQIFAGRWAIEYTAWVAPLCILSNQRGAAGWLALGALWMIPIYVYLALPSGLAQDNTARLATLLGLPYWLYTFAWYLSALLPHPPRWIAWMRAPWFLPPQSSLAPNL
jgi:hypothetical protein